MPLLLAAEIDTPADCEGPLNSKIDSTAAFTGRIYILGMRVDPPDSHQLIVDLSLEHGDLISHEAMI